MTLGILCSNSSNVFLPKPSIQLLLQEREIFKSLEKIKHFKDALGEQHHLPYGGNKTVIHLMFWPALKTTTKLTNTGGLSVPKLSWWVHAVQKPRSTLNKNFKQWYRIN